MHQTLLRYQLPPGTRIYPNQFRELVAKQDIKNPAVFHRDERGQSLVDLPALCFVGATNWVGILAQPNEDDLLNSIIGPATMALSKHLNTSIPISIEQLQVKAEKRFEPVKYRLREIALKRRYETTQKRPVDELIRDRILSGLERLAGKFCIDLPSADFLDVDVNIRIERGVQLQVTGKMTKAFVHVVDADIEMNVDLGGMWMVGNLTSRGYGRLIKENPGVIRGKHIEGEFNASTN